MTRYGGSYYEWCIGTTRDVTPQIIKHKLVQQGDRWMANQALSSAGAKNVFDYFARLGVTTYALNQDKDAACVYIYLKNDHTSP